MNGSCWDALSDDSTLYDATYLADEWWLAWAPQMGSKRSALFSAVRAERDVAGAWEKRVTE